MFSTKSDNAFFGGTFLLLVVAHSLPSLFHFAHFLLPTRAQAHAQPPIPGQTFTHYAGPRRTVRADAVVAQLVAAGPSRDVVASQLGSGILAAMALVAEVVRVPRVRAGAVAFCAGVGGESKYAEVIRAQLILASGRVTRTHSIDALEGAGRIFEWLCVSTSGTAISTPF